MLQLPVQREVELLAEFDCRTNCATAPKILRSFQAMIVLNSNSAV